MDHGGIPDVNHTFSPQKKAEAPRLVSELRRFCVYRCDGYRHELPKGLPEKEEGGGYDA